MDTVTGLGAINCVKWPFSYQQRVIVCIGLVELGVALLIFVQLGTRHLQAGSL